MKHNRYFKSWDKGFKQLIGQKPTKYEGNFHSKAAEQIKNKT